MSAPSQLFLSLIYIQGIYLCDIPTIPLIIVEISHKSHTLRYLVTYLYINDHIRDVTYVNVTKPIMSYQSCHVNQYMFTQSFVSRYKYVTRWPRYHLGQCQLVNKPYLPISSVLFLRDSFRFLTVWPRSKHSFLCPLLSYLALINLRP